MLIDAVRRLATVQRGARCDAVSSDAARSRADAGRRENA